MNKEKKKIFSISINPNLLKEIDQKRGLIKRSTFIEHLSKEGLRWAQLKPNIEDHCNKLLEILPERLPSPVEKHTPVDAKKRINNAREIILEMKQLLKMTVP
jgi:metal-responsive CopG/Arc/MetJ family transcriptional regulator